MCSVAFESMIQEFGKLIFEALNAWEIRDLLASANEQAPEGFSNVPSKLLSFSISYLLNSPVSWELSSPGWVVKRWACSWLLCCSPLLFRFFSWPGFFYSNYTSEYLCRLIWTNLPCHSRSWKPDLIHHWKALSDSRSRPLLTYLLLGIQSSPLTFLLLLES